MSPDELFEQLKQPFPIADHKARELPGGGTKVFLSWKAIVNRLNELCPTAWELTFSDPVISGDYLSVRSRLTIAGVTREGVGVDRTFPEKNAQGKEKIIGSPPRNASAEAFRTAARQFGIGAYIDSKVGQEEYLRLLRQPQRSSSAATKTNPKPQRSQPAHTEPSALTTNRDRFIRLRTLTGHHAEQVKALCVQLDLPTTSNSLNPAQCLQLRDAMLIDWAIAQRRFKHAKHAHNSLDNLLMQFDQPPSDDMLWTVWQEKVMAKPVLEEVTA